MKRFAIAAFVFSFSSLAAHADALFDAGKQAILRQAGCYLVDYSFVETEALKPGYQLDERVYDVESNELIVPIEKSPTEIRLQHVLFMNDPKTGETTFVMKHTGEDWSYEPSFRYDFVGPGVWNPVAVTGEGAWVRKTTNLDDGLRYQCAAAWDLSTATPTWTCATFAPIPGRETRDMGRKDYNTLDRKNTVLSYGNAWLEREDNVKTIFADGVKTPLAREIGKTWYVRQPDATCAGAAAFRDSRTAYWKVLSDVWEEVFALKQPFKEVAAINGAPRYSAMMAVEDDVADKLQAGDLSVLPEAKSRIHAIIEAYRLPASFQGR